MSEEARTPSPSPKAGQVADDEGHQLTDEERMLKDIAEQLELIDALPNDTSEDALNRAPHERKLGRLEFQYHLSVERKRVARELAKFQEKYGALYSEPCLLCLENIHVHASANLIKLFGCCGGFICMACGREVESGPINKCPLCRNPLTASDISKDKTQLMALAERGVSWAQTSMGKSMIQGIMGFKKQEKAGLKWIKKAAAQNHPPALQYLSCFYRYGFASDQGKSRDEEKSNELLMKSANLGYASANSELARWYLTGKHGFEKDPKESIVRATVAHALDASNELAAMTLGVYPPTPEPSRNRRPTLRATT